MNVLLRSLPLLSGILIVSPLAALASPLTEGLSCKQVPLGSDLSSAPVLPPLTFCGPTEEIEKSALSSNNDSQSSIIDEVITRNPSVQSYSLQVKSSEYSLKSARGSWWPSVSMSNSSVLFTDILSSQNYGGQPNTPSSPSTSGTSINPFNGSTNRDGPRGRSSGELTDWSESYSNYTQAYPVIQIQWNFLDPSRYPQISAAKNQLALSKSQLLQATQQARSALLLAYGNYLFAGFQIAEIARLIELQHQIVEQANERVNLKLLPRYQADQEFRSLISYQSQLQSMKIQQANAAVQLESLLQPLVGSDEKDVSLSSTTMSHLSLHALLGPSLQPWPWDRKETVKRSLLHSEALRQIQLQEAIAVDNANEQWGAILPTIGILGYVTYQYTAGSQNYAPPTQPSGAASSTLSNYAGLSISWNLFDGYATRNQAKSYEQNAASLKAQYRDAATQLKASALESINQLTGSDQLIALSLQDLSRAKQIVSDTEARAAVGLAEEYDVLNTEMDVHQSRLQLIEALGTYIKTFAKLEGMVGLK